VGIHDDSAERKLQSMEELKKAGPTARRAIVDVAPLLLHETPQVREAARDLLGRLDTPDEQAREKLLEVYDEATRTGPVEGNAVKQAILEFLLRDDPSSESTQQFVHRALLEANFGEDAANAIAHAGPSAAPLSRTLVPMMADNGPGRVNAVRAIAGIAGGVTPTGPLVEEMLPLLRDSNPVIRSAAAAALAQVGAPAKAAIPRLIEMLGSDIDSEVAAAASALGSFGHDASGAVPSLSREALRRLTASERAPDAVAARVACAQALGQLAPESPEVRSLLLQVVKKKDWIVREHLAPSLQTSKAGKEAIVADLLALADRAPDELVRVNARCALRELGAPVPQ
jgi:HEAT repeat protein